MVARVLTAILAVCVAAAVAVGCGSSAPTPLTKTAFIKQGNAICVHATKARDAALAKAVKQGSQGSNQEELQHYVSTVALPPIQVMTEELGGLGPPKGDEKKVEALIGEFEAGIAALEKDPSKALAHESVFTGANEMAIAYGLTDCTI